MAKAPQYYYCIWTIIKHPLQPSAPNQRSGDSYAYYDNWKRKKERLYDPISTLQELISMRDGYQECLMFTRNDILLIYI